MAERAEELHTQMDGWLRKWYTKSFTFEEFREETGAGPMRGLKFLRGRKDVKPTLTTKDGKVERWKSLAKPFPATEEGRIEEARQERARLDALGEEARKDFEWTKTRGRKKRNRAVIFR